MPAVPTYTLQKLDKIAAKQFKAHTKPFLLKCFKSHKLACGSIENLLGFTANHYHTIDTSNEISKYVYATYSKFNSTKHNVTDDIYRIIDISIHEFEKKRRSQT